MEVKIYEYLLLFVSNKIISERFHIQCCLQYDFNKRGIPIVNMKELYIKMEK